MLIFAQKGLSGLLLDLNEVATKVSNLDALFKDLQCHSQNVLQISYKILTNLSQKSY